MAAETAPAAWARAAVVVEEMARETVAAVAKAVAAGEVGVAAAMAVGVLDPWWRRLEGKMSFPI